MSDDKSKKVKAYLYGEINRLRMHNSELYDDHCAELKTWTLKCGKMGNDIGSLRKQLAEKDELDATWTRRYERLQKQLSSKEAELQEVNEDLENAQWENLKLKKLLEKKERDDQIVIDKVIGEVEALRELMQQKEEEDINEETERPAGVMTVEVEIHSEPAGASISDEIIDLTSDIAEIIVEDVCERRDFGQINELEADGIVKTYYSSESDMDGEKKMAQDSHEDLAVSMPEPVRHDDDAKQRAKYHFWTTLKKRVSIKSRQAKPVPLASKVSESD